MFNNFIANVAEEERRNAEGFGGMGQATSSYSALNQQNAQSSYGSSNATVSFAPQAQTQHPFEYQQQQQQFQEQQLKQQHLAQARDALTRMDPASFKNPLKRLWGYHCHNDVPQSQFPLALIIQKAFSDFLKKNSAPIQREDGYFPGYGPHTDCMWEIRCECQSPQEVDEKKNAFRRRLQEQGLPVPQNPESPELAPFLKSDDGKFDLERDAKTKILPQIGLAALWLMFNHRGQGGYIHFIDHDESLPWKQFMTTHEAVEHSNILYINKFVPIDLNFFLDPPLNEQGGLKDTRTGKELSPETRQHVVEEYLNKNPLAASGFREDFDDLIRYGMRVHVGFSGRSQEQRELGLALYKALDDFLNANDVAADEKFIEESTNVADAGFCFTFLKKNNRNARQIATCLGFALSFVMMNRGNLNVTLLPVADYGRSLENETRQRVVYVGEGAFQNVGFVGRPIGTNTRAIRF